MKRVEPIPSVSLPESFAAVVAESSQADLRILQTGITFLNAHQVADRDSILLVASSPHFLRTALQALESRASVCWLMFADTDTAQVADMLEDNPNWTVDARTAEPNAAAFRIRPKQAGDEALDDVIVGLRLAATLDSSRSKLPAATDTAETTDTAFNLMTLVKRHTPRRVKRLAKKVLARR